MQRISVQILQRNAAKKKTQNLGKTTSEKPNKIKKYFVVFIPYLQAFKHRNQRN